MRGNMEFEYEIESNGALKNCKEFGNQKRKPMEAYGSESALDLP